MLTTAMMTTITEALAAVAEVDEAAVVVLVSSSACGFGPSKLSMQSLSLDFVLAIVEALLASAKVLVAVRGLR